MHRLFYNEKHIFIHEIKEKNGGSNLKLLISFFSFIFYHIRAKNRDLDRSLIPSLLRREAKSQNSMGPAVTLTITGI